MIIIEDFVAALEEWRAARQAIFDTQTTMLATPDQFARLGNAEHALMALARIYRINSDAELLASKPMYGKSA